MTTSFHHRWPARAALALLLLIGVVSFQVQASHSGFHPRRALKSNLRDLIVRKVRSLGYGPTFEVDGAIESLAGRLAERFQAQIADFLSELDFEGLADDIRQRFNTELDINILDAEGNPLDAGFTEELSKAILESVHEQLEQSIPGLKDNEFAEYYNKLVKESILDRLDRDVLDNDFAKALSESVKEKMLDALADAAIDPTSDDFASKLRQAILSKLKVGGEIDLSRFLDRSFVDGLTEAIKKDILSRFAGGNPLEDGFTEELADDIRRKIDESFSENDLGSALDADFVNKIRMSVLNRVAIGIRSYDPCELIGSIACGSYTSEQLLQQLLPGLDSFLLERADRIKQDALEIASTANDLATNLADSIRNNVQTLVEDIKSRNFDDFDFELDSIFDPGYWDNLADNLKEEILSDIDALSVEENGSFAGIKDVLDGLLNDIRSKITLTIGDTTINI